jgi:type IV pilus assembly protein PilA
MKKKNGFTLVELLAVIVVLALLMVIAIPAVLDVMNQARRSTFIEMATKVITNTMTQYTYDAHATIAGAGVYVYDITQDLGSISTGSYQGYVVVDATDVDNPRYILTMWDNNYQIVNYDTSRGLPTENSGELTSVTSATKAYTAVDVCTAVNASGSCYNRQGYLLKSAS